MAGGIGSRFWPMSTPDLPKQFHDILGIGKTLIRMTFERILPICHAENVLIVTNAKYKKLVHSNLPEISENQILCEPHMRNTAPCLAYANFWIQNKNSNANIVVLSADQLITNEVSFIEDIQLALFNAQASDHLITVGIKPSNPNTGYGYVQFSESFFRQQGNVREVKTFTEKPDLALAEKFLQSGEFFWNAGIFVWSLKSIQNAFKTHLTDVFDLFNDHKEVFGTDKELDVIQDIYPKCTNISIDYGILEKAENVLVVLSDFGWSDLGTWGSVYNHLPKDEQSNAHSEESLAFFESTGNVVRLEKLKNAVIQGLENYVIVESNGTLLICKKSEEQRIKQFSSALKR